MNFLLFLAPFSWGTQKREASAPKASGCFMGGTCAVREEPVKQKPRSCWAQELARSRAQEMRGRKKRRNLPQGENGRRTRPDQRPAWGNTAGVSAILYKVKNRLYSAEQSQLEAEPVNWEFIHMAGVWPQKWAILFGCRNY